MPRREESAEKAVPKWWGDIRQPLEILCLTPVFTPSCRSIILFAKVGLKRPLGSEVIFWGYVTALFFFCFSLGFAIPFSPCPSTFCLLRTDDVFHVFVCLFLCVCVYLFIYVCLYLFMPIFSYLCSCLFMFYLCDYRFILRLCTHYIYVFWGHVCKFPFIVLCLLCKSERWSFSHIYAFNIYVCI